MPGLVPGIHDLEPTKTWMAGTSPAMTRKDPKQKGCAIVSHSPLSLSGSC